MPDHREDAIHNAQDKGINVEGQAIIPAFKVDVSVSVRTRCTLESRTIEQRLISSLMCALRAILKVAKTRHYIQ